MSETPGFRDVFDQVYYSCELGYKKPDTNYFKAILAEIALPPHDILFIDDHGVNVGAARRVGLRAAVFKAEWDAYRHTLMRRLLAQYDLHVT